jgi:hypothetical protein
LSLEYIVKVVRHGGGWCSGSLRQTTGDPLFDSG